MESQKKYPRTFSFEFFPPRNADGRASLSETIKQLAQLKPKFFSVTFGAGGSTRAGTYETVKQILALKQNAAPHISCIGTTRAEVRALLDAYRQLGIRHLVALRGDLPKDTPQTGDFRYANDLVAFIRDATGDEFIIEVAAYPEFHPESPCPEADIRAFVNKVKAGADSAITQYFFNTDSYWRFVDECEATGMIDVPIVPGIMPITNFKQLARFSDTCGAEIPRWIRKRLEGYGDDLDSIRAFGLDVTTDLCDKLLTGGAPGLHFYTLNRAGPTCTVWERLGL